ncbi:MAG: hypothetical protein HQ512_11455 [Rhodospirillales bacterium]|nr:hypothetical protein [Rhodospirillales bacterium]
MTSALHQITMGFSAEDDRLLLRISTTEKTEYQLWLTRRFVHVLWSALIRVLEIEPAAKTGSVPAAKKAVMAIEHEEALSAADFAHGHDEGNENLTLESGPLLVVGGSVKPDKGGLTQLTLQTQNGAEINVALNKNLTHALCKLLVETTAKAEWGMGLAISDAAALIVPTDKTQVH